MIKVIRITIFTEDKDSLKPVENPREPIVDKTPDQLKKEIKALMFSLGLENTNVLLTHQEVAQ